MTTNSHISSVVMRRVRVIHAVRPLFSTTALASLLFLLAVWGIGREVWVSHVLANFSHIASNPERIPSFLASAFLNTRFVVQALTIVAGGAFVWMAREIVQATASRTQLA